MKNKGFTHEPVHEPLTSFGFGTVQGFAPPKERNPAKKEATTVRRRSFTLIELLVVVAIVMVTLLVLTPFIHMAKARARKISCANNLRHISLGLHAYAADHNGAFPQTLGELYPNYIEDQKSFDCPASKSVGSPAGPDYIYVQSLTENAPPKDPIAQDIENNHKRGKYILKVDGSLEWIARR
ncbi:MAG: DUF1559 domain-containing protein [Candidatus Omnitrophota bacterium]